MSSVDIESVLNLKMIKNVMQQPHLTIAKSMGHLGTGHNDVGREVGDDVVLANKLVENEREQQVFSK